MGFLLIPVYTRYIEPADYGALEIFRTFIAIGFACLTVGLTSAINKCYHRDCKSEDEKATVLATAVFLDLPVLVVAAVAAVALSGPLSVWLTGTTDAMRLVPLAAGWGLSYSLATFVLAGLRAQERALAFSTLMMAQFALNLGVNLLLVVGYGLGVRGVLWGNLLSNTAVMCLAIAVAAKGSVLTLNPRLVRPLLSFGLYLVPLSLAGWVMNSSDRYLLRLFCGLQEVAVYGVGYKFGMVVQIALVWPFQLAWPAYSFAISNQEGHQATYARTLTYLVTVLLAAVLLLALAAPAGLPLVVGGAYREAHQVIPLVALAYALSGIQYCVSPGIHIAGRTWYLSIFAVLAAAINLGLNFLLIPRFGMMGAAWSTVLSFFVLASATWLLAQRVYPVSYEYGRLAKAAVTCSIIYAVARMCPESPSPLNLLIRVTFPLIAFPCLVLMTGFLYPRERAAAAAILRRYVPGLGRQIRGAEQKS